MNDDAIVFGVVKEVERTVTKNGRYLLGVGIASISVPVGEIERSRPLIATFPMAPTGNFTPETGWRGEWYLDQLAKIAGPEAEALKPWLDADLDATVTFFREALLGKCFWWRVRYSGEGSWKNVDPLTPEEAGAAMRGGVL